MDLLVAYLRVKTVELSDLAMALLFALAVAIAFVAISRGYRRTRLRTVLRVLMARRIWSSASTVLDYKYSLLNMTVFPLLLSLTILSTQQVAGFVGAFLPPGPEQQGFLTETQARVVLSVALFFALEFAYWLDHYLAHRIPILWEFHKVHHTAEVLTPLTVYRMHPFDSLVYYNVKSIVAGLVYCAAIFVFQIKPIATVEGTIIVVYMWLYGHLQHSELWISFHGRLGKILFSPAHHQIHHSKARIHHNTNFGMSLAIFDWMFGTLHVPTRKKQRLEFGIAHDPHAHSLRASLSEPIRRAYRRFVPAQSKPENEAPTRVADHDAMLPEDRPEHRFV